MAVKESDLEQSFIKKLEELKYTYRPDIRNRSNTYYFANNHSQHFAFNADERFLPIYQLASEDNRKITHLDDFADQFLAQQGATDDAGSGGEKNKALEPEACHG